MYSDKISKNLEKHLKVLGQKIRLDILKKLFTNEKRITFSELRKEILQSNSNSSNLSFHLNILKENNLINSLEDGYSLTRLGNKILKQILDIERVLNEENKSVIIRTSNYSTEPFKLEKITDYLIKEGEIEPYLAKKIARISKKRLYRTNIEYLTAPLMREYINAILIEEGLEECRHKLTRLGVPPFDTHQYFTNSEINPNEFLVKLGSEVSEQFLLLNLLPKHLSDLYLTNKLLLLNLNQWALKPFSISLNLHNFLNSSDKIDSGDMSWGSLFEKSKPNISNILKSAKIINQLRHFVSEDVLVQDAGNILSYDLENFHSKLDLFHFLLKSNNFATNRKTSNLFCSTLSLNFSHILNKSLDYDTYELFSILTNLFTGMNSNNKILIFLQYSKENNIEILMNFLNILIESEFKHNFIFYAQPENMRDYPLINNNKNTNHVIPQIISDKILINLISIAKESKQDDDIFFQLLEDRLNDVFELFKYKIKFLSKKLKNCRVWKEVLLKGFGENYENWLDYVTNSISFFGLNQAVLEHCGLELDRIKTSEKFGLEILEYMSSRIDEQNICPKNLHLLTQPYSGNFSQKSQVWENMYSKNNGPDQTHLIIRDDSNLSLLKKIDLFNKFNKYLSGGTTFHLSTYELSNRNTQETLSHLIESDIPAFCLYDSKEKLINH